MRCISSRPCTPADTPPHTHTNSQVRVNARLNGTTALRGLGGLTPKNVTIRLCFSKPFTADRPWRKPAPVLDVRAHSCTLHARTHACTNAAFACRHQQDALLHARLSACMCMLPRRALTPPRLRPLPCAPRQSDKSCPHMLATLPVSANGTYTATWKVPKGAPRATWYAQVRCLTHGVKQSFN